MALIETIVWNTNASFVYSYFLLNYYNIVFLDCDKSIISKY